MTALGADSAPRYTSYPTAPHFHPGVKPETVRGWIECVGENDALSLYLHVPFCDRLCWFCACHTRHTLRYEPVAAFLRQLHREIANVSAALAGRGRVLSVHFGGGSPTMLRPNDFLELMQAIRRAFTVEPDAEISVEIDPNDIDEARLDALAQGGLTRASLGVQDFDPVVQRAINREQSFELTRSIVEGLRRRGVRSINLDLVYGLPHQTERSVGATVERCLSLRPDRIALFGYAHVPWFKKHQAMIDESALPGAAERLVQAARAAATIGGAGYAAIGLDHFALPEDGLSVAAAAGRLFRNFQGYTNDDCETLIGLGPSSISRYREGYAQNHPAMGQYVRAVEGGGLPVCRGIVLSEDDRLRGWVIERLMCDFALDADAAVARFGKAARPVLAEAATLAANEPDLLTAEGGHYRVPAPSRPFIRSIAARFDPYFRSGVARHSQAV